MSIHDKEVREEARKFEGKRVYFTGRHSESRRLIAEGYKSGLVVRSLMALDRTRFEFEIDIGEAGSPKLILLPRKAFVLQKPESEEYSEKESSL